MDTKDINQELLEALINLVNAANPRPGVWSTDTAQEVITARALIAKIADAQRED